MWDVEAANGWRIFKKTPKNEKFLSGFRSCSGRHRRIWLYIALDNPDAADKQTSAFFSQFSKLAAMPEIGRTREELSHNLRSFPIGRYIIFYRQNNEGVEVVRVLHGARNFPPLFE